MVDNKFTQLNFQVLVSPFYLCYYKDTQIITFDLKRKTVHFAFNTLDIDELKAVNEQLEYLKWI